MKRLTKKYAYANFANAAQRTLEGFLMMARAKCSDDLRHFMQLVHAEITQSYPHLNRDFLDPRTKSLLRAIDESLDRHAQSIALEMSQHWLVVRYFSYQLANASEQQAKINVLGGDPVKITREELERETYDNTSLGPLTDRAYLALSRLRRDIIDAVEMSRIMGDDLSGCMQRVMRVFPDPELVKQPRILRRVREADAPKDKALRLSDFLTREEYEEVVEEYKKEFVPKWRDPRAGKLPSPVSIGDEEGFVLYPWQLEKEMTEDFVAKVRRGEHEGAKAQGITEFVWIAVLDDRTDACCRKRNGLTTGEIKSKLEDEWSGDDCQAVAPPAHFNCRCRLAPATDELPEEPSSNEAEFEEWLNA